MRHALALGFITSLTWALWSGHTEPMIVGFGVASVLITLLVVRRMGVLDEEGVPLSIVQPGQITYIPWLLWQVVLSNLDVAKRVWSPDMGLKPSMLSVHPSQTSWAARVLYANSITLTPGTVSVRMYDGEILVHALHDDAAAGLASGDMDARVTKLEGAP